MTYITRSQFREYATKNRQVSKFAEAASKYLADVVVFLSHSHKDSELIDFATVLLTSQGVKVYIDRSDQNLPENTSPETANFLKEKIRSCQKLVMVASDNAINISRWVPWELGFADGLNRNDRIAIIPVTEISGWKGTEYVAIYPTIELAGADWSVWSPERKQFTKLSEWLRRNN